jgi:ubiquinone/menaquinone biosynthesis C-methylase UbiE
MNFRKLWNNVLGRRMTRRMMKLIVPDLVWNQEIYGRLLRQHVNKNIKWLDVGCGWRILGKDLEPIEDDLVANAGVVVGCDLALDNLTKHRIIQNLVLASADNLPFRDASFDLITLNMVVEHLDNPAKTFCETVRVLSPGGLLIIHTPNLLNYGVFLNHTIARRLPRKFVLRFIKWAERRKEEDVFPTFYRANTVHRLSQICSRFGLKEESCRILTAPQPFFIFFFPLALPQILLMRLTMSRYFRKFGATILMVLKYEPVGQAPKAAEQSKVEAQYFRADAGGQKFRGSPSPSARVT